jgi:hypothetical protein
MKSLQIWRYALVLLVGGGTPFTIVAQAWDQQIVGTLQADGAGWASLELVNVEAFPVDAEPRFGTRSKTIFRGPEVGALIYTVFIPSWDTKMRPASPHYHLWHEWGYTLKGDSVLYEAISPYQKNGKMQWKPQGGWLDRPPYSIHSVNWKTGGGLRPQTPYYLLLYEEGDGSVITIGPNGDHYGVKPGVRPDPYEPDWRQVKQWNAPWLVDTARDLEWETDSNVEGRFLKWLSDDWQGGFRAQLVKIPPGWTPPENTPDTYFERANRMRYMIWGDMKVWMFQRPGQPGEVVTVSEDFFVYQPPRSIWGYGDGPVTELGAIWLEVTYARGLSHGGGPIEEPKVAR